MRSAHRALIALAIGSAAIHCSAGAAAETRLKPRQMAKVSAGAAGLAAFQSAGKNIQNLVGNVALDFPNVGVAQSRTGTLATGQSVAASSANTASAGNVTAAAATAGEASGSSAALRSLGLTTAIDITVPGGGTIGFAGSLASFFGASFR